jgi:aminocarboxymuconate-semialdehyde decarboxylase
MSPRKLDIYNHVLPSAVIARMKELAPAKGDIVKRVASIAMLHDIAARVKMMDQWPGYQQVLTLSNPPLEMIAGPNDSLGMAQRVKGDSGGPTR